MYIYKRNKINSFFIHPAMAQTPNTPLYQHEQIPIPQSAFETTNKLMNEHLPWEKVEDPTNEVSVLIHKYQVETRHSVASGEYVCTPDGSYVISVANAIAKLTDYASLCKLNLHFSRCVKDFIERKEKFMKRLEQKFPNFNLSLSVGKQSDGEEWIFDRRQCVMICTLADWMNPALEERDVYSIMLRMKIAADEARQVIAMSLRK